MLWEVVRLTGEQRRTLTEIIDKGPPRSRKVLSSRALLWMDRAPGGPGVKDGKIADLLRLTVQEVVDLKNAFVRGGLEAALALPARGDALRCRKDKSALEDQLVALALSEAPQGRERWSVRLLAEKAVEGNLVQSISHTTIHRILKKRNLSLLKGGLTPNPEEPEARAHG